MNELFASWLVHQRNGDLLRELSKAMATLASAVVETGKPGELTIKIKLKQVKRANAQQVVFSDLVTVRTPTYDREPSLFFFNEDTGGLSREDPRQTVLPLRELQSAVDVPLEDLKTPATVEAKVVPTTL